MTQVYLSDIKSSQNACYVEPFLHPVLSVSNLCKYDNPETGVFLIHYSEIGEAAREV
ncbi:hypothetical protein I8751_04530 [Nostocaceae cyanobacterium CENA357]|uniref:Uncharacterized protein n=1 Tax=Atlanticothrix silvestris CENA357 TaxID=1725252 RepID=A0A8J7KZQ3_9CYAN|nr:hypothetical protein [Atlanticothrix silvestris]MBH8551651.1 hypothetical protein [Atlanticothrix silvestris CENA357]